MPRHWSASSAAAVWQSAGLSTGAARRSVCRLPPRQCGRPRHSAENLPDLIEAQCQCGRLLGISVGTGRLPPDRSAFVPPHVISTSPSPPATVVGSTSTVNCRNYVPCSVETSICTGVKGAAEDWHDSARGCRFLRRRRCTAPRAAGRAQRAGCRTGRAGQLVSGGGALAGLARCRASVRPGVTVPARPPLCDTWARATGDGCNCRSSAPPRCSRAQTLRPARCTVAAGRAPRVAVSYFHHQPTSAAAPTPTAFTRCMGLRQGRRSESPSGAAVSINTARIINVLLGSSRSKTVMSPTV